MANRLCIQLMLRLVKKGSSPANPAGEATLWGPAAFVFAGVLGLFNGVSAWEAPPCL